jgi:hypothetical protein
MLYLIGIPFYLWGGILIAIAFFLPFKVKKNNVVKWVFNISGSISLIFSLFLLLAAYSSIEITNETSVSGNRFLVTKFGATLSKSTYYIEKRRDFLFFSYAHRYLETYEGPLFIEMADKNTLLVRLYDQRNGKILKKLKI